MKVITLISGGDIGGAKTHVLSLLHGLGKTEQVNLPRTPGSLVSTPA